MTKKHLAQSLFIIVFLLFAIPALAGDVVYYDNKGKMIDKPIIQRAEKIIQIAQRLNLPVPEPAV